MNELPAEGGTIDTDNGQVRAADQALLHVLTLMDDIYGWVQIVEVLRDHVIVQYPSGRRYAQYLLQTES